MSQNSVSYCHHCGFKLINIARFCSQCGVSLGSLSNKPEPPPDPPKQEKRTFAPYVPGKDDDDDEESRYDTMSHLDISIDRLEVDTGPKNRGEKLVDIVEAGQRFGPGSVEKRDAIPKMSKKKFLSEFAKEAGPLRKD